MIIDKIISLLGDEKVRKILERASEGMDISISTDFKASIDLVHRIGDLNSEESREVIELLAKYGIIEVVRYGSTIGCPYCYGMNVKETFKCPTCESVDIGKGYILQHLRCGKSFSTDKLDVDKCPACGNPITSQRELKLIGGLFKCNNCKNMFEIPYITYVCSDCRSQFGIREAGISSLYEYRVSEDGLKILEAIKSLKIVIDRLLKSGFKVESPGKLMGESGVEHTFPMVIRLQGENPIYTVDITGFFEEIDDTYILKNYIKIIDTPEIKHVYIINTELTKSGLNIPIRGGITVVYATKVEEMIDKLIDILSKRG